MIKRIVHECDRCHSETEDVQIFEINGGEVELCQDCATAYQENIEEFMGVGDK